MTSGTAGFEETLNGMLTSVERDLLLPIIEEVKERNEREGRKRYAGKIIQEEHGNYRELLNEERNLYRELALLRGKPSDDYSFTDILENTILQEIRENMDVQVQVLKISAGTCASWKVFVCKKGKRNNVF